MGQVGFHSFLQDPFPFFSTLFEMGRDSRRKLNEAQIQKWHSYLKTNGHGHFVRVRKSVIRQKESLLKCQHALERGRSFG